MNKIIFSSIFIFSILQTVFSQQFNTLSGKDIDSITISTIHYQDKTTDLPLAKDFHPAIKDTITSKWSLPYYEVHKTKDTIFIIEQKKLTSKEIMSLNKILKSHKSYIIDTPLMEHYDIQIDYYKKNSVMQSITISSYTKKIVINRKGCKIYIDNDEQEIDSYFFRGKISKKAKFYIVKLLKAKKLWRKEQNFFEDL